MELFDSHAHYNDEKFEEDKEEILNEIYESGITKLVCVGYDIESSRKAVEIASNHDFIYATVGIHPSNIPGGSDYEEKNNIGLQINMQEAEKIKKEEEINPEIKTPQSKINFEAELNKQLEQIEKLAKSPKVVAIGEIGLDYHWDKENKEDQKLAFKKQIEIANKLDLPIVIHTRDAIYDTLEILKQEKLSNNVPDKISNNISNNVSDNKGVLHCCPLNVDLVREGLKLGFYISFAGIITFKNAKNVEEVVSMVPLDKMLIETDSPYLAPEPNRGTRNDSRNVKYIAEKIAKIKNIPVEEIAKITYENAIKLFKLVKNRNIEI